MDSNFIFSAALLLMALLLASPALNPISRLMWGDRLSNMRRFAWRDFWRSELGVVAITYLYPTENNNATPPTGYQAAQVPTQTAQVFFADSDTEATVVHNWGLPASSPFNLFPEPWMIKLLGGASDSSFATNFTFGLTNTNSITITKLSIGTGSGGTYGLYLRLPHSVGR